MNVYIAVVFLVMNGQPAFWKHPEFFHSEQKCAAVAEAFMKQAEDQGIPLVSGTCLPLKIGQLM